MTREEKRITVPELFLWVLGVGVLLIVTSCAAPQVQAPAPVLKKPWRVMACHGDASAEVRIASKIPISDLNANCASDWEAGYVKVTVRFDGAFNEQLTVQATWFDAANKVIVVENVFDRQFTLGSAATRSETWEAPTPKAQRVRLDVSCTRC
ncbi:MAG: hypothetical protein CL877_09945 [Dehalococcoidales bacterium]|jgi:hypothetical protein|nr:hypothetical protein [Dehalococcoidales bacterium]|tara:strand:+ start:668 stop:1123 length:456 start_codon:yes stop_codon:yes gene_type:complete